MKKYVISIPGIFALFGVTVLALLILVISAGEQERNYEGVEYCESDIPSGMNESVFEKIVKERSDIGRILVDNHFPDHSECPYNDTLEFYSIDKGPEGNLRGVVTIAYYGGNQLLGMLEIDLCHDERICDRYVHYYMNNCDISWTETIV